MSNATTVDAAWLQARPASSGVVLVDTRPAAEYWSGHLPGARHFDPTAFPLTDTGEKSIQRLETQLAWAFSALGIAADSLVVFYENKVDVRATRAAWLLEYAGHAQLALLEGGLAGAGDIALTNAAPAYVPTDFRLQPVRELLVGADELAALIRDGTVRVVDTRKLADYQGQESSARRAGRIPGALHADYLAAGGGRLDGTAALAARLAEAGIGAGDRIVTYCVGGGRAAHAYYALKRAGYAGVCVYAGSWNEWGNRDDLEVDTRVLTD